MVDCTGHETDLVLRDTRTRSDPPGYQIAYGCVVNVDETDVSDLTRVGPYDKEAMTLFDYRTDHFSEGTREMDEAEKAPTFMYVMPLEGNKVFFEETSLVARPAISFRECKDRCFKRLDHLGIKVAGGIENGSVGIEEEEFCYIPMGGPLPAQDQRVVAFGGAAAMVHPSTGYHLCRAMTGAGDVARTLRRELKPAAEAGVDLDRAAALAYDAIWSPETVRQRNFAVFGGEFLMKQKVQGLRGFFDGFFRLPIGMWAGFLAGWPGLPNNDKHESWLSRMSFGLNFIVRIPLGVAADMAANILSYSVTNFPALPQSVTPLLGEPEGYSRPEERAIMVGDVAAKMEARDMITESKLGEQVPVAFGSAGGGGDLSVSAAQERESGDAPESDEVKLESFQ